jgi:hypothetical protein
MRWSYQSKFTRLTTRESNYLCSPNDVVFDPGLPWYGRTYRIAYEARSWYPALPQWVFPIHVSVHALAKANPPGISG